MENTVEIMMDTFCKAMGGYALQKRRLIADYKDRNGKDLNQDLTVWHSRKASDKSLVDQFAGNWFKAGTR